ncbi:MAG: DUF3034 family protein [Acidobacteria bacterium]|nr:DUF3034 family protein [Acidobacteriota bacterium]MBI3424728.1 DUF3034 family protein [Acidobacteriota bacterium]
MNHKASITMPGSVSLRALFSILSLFIPLFAFTSSAAGQGLNWEGQTGAFITPFAYTSKSSNDNIGHPQVAFHFLNTGSVIGNNMQASITVGFLGHAEFGYTRSFNAAGKTAGLSPLFEGGFNTVHGKFNFVPENAAKTKWVPGLAAGFVARTQVRHVGAVLKAKDTANGDLYLVATKTVTQVKGLPFLLNFGVKATNASVFGIAGNAPDWQARAFGAAAIVVKGPSKSTLIFGSEFAQQPHFIKDLPGATVPTTLTYFVRIVPNGEVPFNLDFGVAQAVGKIAPGVDLKARNQLAMGLSYRF